MPRPKGLPKTGGRQKGTPNKLTTEVKEPILSAFEKVGGEDYLVTVAEGDPRTFCTLLGRVIPRAVEGDDQGAEHMLQRIAEARRRAFGQLRPRPGRRRR